MTRLMDALTICREAGIITPGKFSTLQRRVQIHETFWILRDGGASVSDALEMVATRYSVTTDTVETYSRGRDRFQDTPAPDEPDRIIP